VALVDSILQFIEELSRRVPVEVFAPVASFLEELLAPIPSPFVMTLAGTMAAAQNSPFWYLFVIAMIAAAGKTLASFILFVIADKAEDVILSKVGRFIGVTHEQVEHFGKRFTGSRRDYVTLFLIRAAPFIPSAPISLLCGVLALPKKLYLISTYFGTIVRDFIYLYIGYVGLEAADVITHGFEGISSFITLGMAVIAVGVVAWIAVRKYLAYRTHRKK
jgi:membrane protein DedA with SNARE-associated domain